MDEKKHLSEVEANFAAFQKLLPDLLKSHPGKYVVMHDREVVNYFDTLRDAVLYGNAAFGEQDFSVQEVTRDTINLGHHAYAVGHHSY